MDWSSRKVTADLIIPDSEGRVLLIRRAGRCRGRWALPGGYVSQLQGPAETAVKEAEEEVGLRVRLDRQFYTYGKVGRDPGATNVSVVYLAYPCDEEPVINPEEVLEARRVTAEEAARMARRGRIAFDHADMLADYFYMRDMLKR